MLSLNYKESQEINKNRRRQEKIPKLGTQELRAPRNACDPLQMPDQQNRIYMDLDMQIQRSQKVPMSM